MRRSWWWTCWRSRRASSPSALPEPPSRLRLPLALFLLAALAGVPACAGSEEALPASWDGPSGEPDWAARLASCREALELVDRAYGDRKWEAATVAWSRAYREVYQQAVTEAAGERARAERLEAEYAYGLLLRALQGPDREAYARARSRLEAALDRLEGALAAAEGS